MTRVAVIGAGAFGTVFAQVLADAGNSVRLLARDPAVAKTIDTRHRNPARLPSLRLSRRIHATGDPKVALRGAEIVFVAVTSQVADTVMRRLSALVPRDAVAVSLMKGIELGSGRRMTQILRAAGGIDAERIAAVSGPNLAAELAAREPAATVVAAGSEAVARTVANAIATQYLRPYLNPDVVGVEVGGAVKNVIAFGVGVAAGLGYGMNTRVTLMTRGLAEMSRLGVALGADEETFMGLAGVGDLNATCFSERSRNQSVGRLVGQGKSVEEALALTGEIAESVQSSAAILALARAHGVDMPITAAVVAVIHHGLDARDMGRELMARPKRAEGLRYEEWA
jgi:glycerol-3-phosphate dehydrogenase (NAD(P)+)